LLNSLSVLDMSRVLLYMQLVQFDVGLNKRSDYLAGWVAEMLFTRW